MRAGPGIIAPPTTCSCGRPSALVLLEVFNEQGRVLQGAYSQFGSVKGRTRRRRILRPEYRFKRWIVECAACINRDSDQQRLFG
jgi:hypothetical protein